MMLLDKTLLKKIGWALLSLLILFLTSKEAMKSGGYDELHGYLLMMAFLIVASGSRRIFWWFAFPLVLLYALYAPIGYHYGPPNYQYFAAFMSTSTADMKEFVSLLSYKNYLAGIYAIVGVLVYRWLCVSKDVKLYRNRTLLVVLMLLALAAQAPFLYPVKLYTSITKVGDEIQRLNHLTETNGWKVTQVKPKYNNYILVIGESVRRDYLHAYGYPVADTPFMDAHGVRVDGFFSAGATTVQSLRLTLTLPHKAKHEPDYTKNLIGLASKAGFHTAWLSNQGYLGKFDTPVTYIAHWADVQHFLKMGSYNSANTDDTLLLPLVKKSLNQGAKEKMIVVHMYGSHPDACDRVHGFRPEYVSQDAKYQQVACYLTTVRKLDHFLQQLNALAVAHQRQTGENFAIVYFADHGLIQTLDDDKVEMKHNGHYLQAYHVPLYLLASDIQGSHMIKRRLSALNFTQGMANLMGIKSPQLDANYQLFAKGSDDPTTDFLDVSHLRKDPPIDLSTLVKVKQ